MVIDVIIKGNHFVFLEYLVNGKEFSRQVFCIVIRKNFAYLTIEFLPIIVTPLKFHTIELICFIAILHHSMKIISSPLRFFRFWYR